MRLENISLAKEYAEAAEDDFSVFHMSFENALQQVEYFFLK